MGSLAGTMAASSTTAERRGFPTGQDPIRHGKEREIWFSIPGGELQG